MIFLLRLNSFFLLYADYYNFRIWHLYLIVNIRDVRINYYVDNFRYLSTNVRIISTHKVLKVLTCKYSLILKAHVLTALILRNDQAENKKIAMSLDIDSSIAEHDCKLFSILKLSTGTYVYKPLNPTTLTIFELKVMKSIIAFLTI